MIQDTYTGSGKSYTLAVELATRPGFFQVAFPTAAKRSLKKEIISCSKQPQTFSLHLSMVLSTCLTRSPPFTSSQMTRVFLSNFILFEPREIWTQLRNKQEKACSHLCYVNLLWSFVEFFLILNTTAVTRNVTVTSGNAYVQSGWQLPVEAVLDSIVYLKGIYNHFTNQTEVSRGN